MEVTSEVIVVSIVTSVIASAIFFVIMYFLRPTMRVSDQIAEHINEEGRKVYSIKVYNSNLVRAVSVEVEGLIIRRIPKDTDILLKATNLSFTRDRMFKLTGWWPWDKESKYAWRLSIIDDVRTLWSDGQQYIEIVVTARHPWSGSTRWFIKRFYNGDDTLITGEFDGGTSMVIRRKALGAYASAPYPPQNPIPPYGAAPLL
ncbi:MAG: hypothetical protein KA175_00570 [Flavobacteriales bacterium]|nr:hypothetical protein [Flavobacteriales bacterium]MBP6696076.1 hypothetical protein [Flavobacteriales bacterium]